MTVPTDTVSPTAVHRCGCCDRELPETKLAELGTTPGVYICAGCGLWAARRAGLWSALRGVRPRHIFRFMRH